MLLIASGSWLEARGRSRDGRDLDLLALSNDRRSELLRSGVTVHNWQRPLPL